MTGYEWPERPREPHPRWLWLALVVSLCMWVVIVALVVTMFAKIT